MKRKIYLEGEIGERFIKEFEADVSSYRDAVKLLEANFPELKEYLIESQEKGVGFTFETEGSALEKEEDFILPIREGDITICSVPAGSKSAAGKILAAVAIVALIIINPAAAFYTAANAAAGTAASLTIAGSIAASVALSLAMTGIQQLMAPDPASDSDAPQAYLFNGSQQNIVEGDPVPVLYGELRVPGRPIGFGVINGSNEYNPLYNYDFDFSGIFWNIGAGY